MDVPSALDAVDGEVRELIRRRGLDPFTDPAPVRVLVRDVVAEYSERSLNSALPPIGDPSPSSATCSTGSPASGRCSATSTTRRSRRSGSTTPRKQLRRSGHYSTSSVRSGSAPCSRTALQGRRRDPLGRTWPVFGPGLLDELREHHNWEAWSAVTKTTLARPAPQVLGFSETLGDKSSVVLASLREKALASAADRNTTLGIFEWSAPDDCALNDRAAWAQANPALGHRMSEQAIASALEVDPEDVFRTEVLCQ